jgi:lysophospholipase L1-like esterase
MMVGDSITVGMGYSLSGEPANVGGRRVKLKQLAGANINFVGSFKNGPSTLTDQNYQAYGGQNSVTVLDTALGELLHYRPTVVFLCVGTNDTSEVGMTSDLMIARIRDRLRIWQNTLPGVKYFIEGLIGNSTAGRNTLMLEFNSKVPALITLLTGEGLAMQPFVDHYATGVRGTDGDGTHPSVAGHDQMGQNDYDALVAAGLL